jgi:hypothetical protein
MVYGLVHNETMAPEVAKIIENARQVYRFRALLVAIVSEFSGIDLNAPSASAKESLWKSVDKVREQRNDVLHRDGLLKVTRQEAEQSLALARTLLENVLPAVLASLGLHLHASRVCGDSH